MISLPRGRAYHVVFPAQPGLAKFDVYPGFPFESGLGSEKFGLAIGWKARVHGPGVALEIWGFPVW